MNKDRTKITFHGEDDIELLNKLRQIIKTKDGIEPSYVNALRMAVHFYIKATQG